MQTFLDDNSSLSEASELDESEFERDSLDSNYNVNSSSDCGGTSSENETESTKLLVLLTFGR